MADPGVSGEVAVAALRHDLRTPLNQIIGYSELVSEDLEGEVHARTREDLDKIGRAARGLAELITREIQPGRIALVGQRMETTGGEDATATKNEGSGQLGQPSLPENE
ncbi:MAG: histidine kinase dimerization/phospho-acceptor domain-containing protein, partial [Chthoniobacterales bacterium]